MTHGCSPDQPEELISFVPWLIPRNAHLSQCQRRTCGCSLVSHQTGTEQRTPFMLSPGFCRGSLEIPSFMSHQRLTRWWRGGLGVISGLYFPGDMRDFQGFACIALVSKRDNLIIQPTGNSSRLLLLLPAHLPISPCLDPPVSPPPPVCRTFS